MAEHEQIKPLTAPSPSIYHPTPDQEAPGYLKQHRRHLYFCGFITTTILILGLTALILALTVFKIKDPTITINTIDISSIILSSPASASVNATLTADVSIRNPNMASFRFGNSSTEFYLDGAAMGTAYGPSGRVAARRTLRMNMTVGLTVDRAVADLSFVAGGELNLTSFTDVMGRVTVMGIYKRDIEVGVNCSMVLETVPPGVINKVCQTSVS